ncbi:hypothetical protein ACFL0V_06220 [Nanoarchaeota archaeon]
MTKINYSLILKDLFYNKKVLVRNLILTVFTTALVALFPLVTQFYIRWGFRESVPFLIWATVIIAIIYIGKLIADIHITKFENKLFLKIRSNMQEKLIKHFLKKNYPFEQMYKLIDKKVRLHVLFIQRFLLGNFKSIIKIIAVMITIIFFDINLFLYSLIFLPIFIIYLLLFNHFFHKNRAKVDNLLKKAPAIDIVPFIQKEFRRKNSPDQIFKKFKRLDSLLLEKELRNRNSLVSLNQTLRASITFFRVIYLAYFGYFIITYDIHISGLIVGLLFLTILIRSFTSILESILFYHIAKDSVIQLQRRLNPRQH